MKRGAAAETFVLIPLRDVIGFVIRGLPLAIILATLGVAGVWMLSQQRPDSYTAVAYLLSVRQDQTPNAVRGILPGSLDPALYRAAVSDGTVLDEVRANWGSFSTLPEDFEILSNLRVQSDNQLQSSVVRVQYRAASPLDAAEVATAVARELVRWDQERTLRPLQEWRDRLEGELAELNARIATSAAPGPELLLARDQRLRDLAELQSTLPVSQLSMLSEAEVPSERDGRGLITAAALAIVIGVLLAYLLRLLRFARRPASAAVDPVSRAPVQELS